MVELKELILDGVRLNGSGVGVRGRPCGPGVGARRAMLLARLKGRTRPRYDMSFISAIVEDPGSGLGPAEKEGKGRHVTYYITLHSPSFCWPILLRVMRSRWRGPFLPERLRSSRRSRALGKSWAFLSVSNVHSKFTKGHVVKAHQRLSNTTSWHPPCWQEFQCPSL